MSGREHLAGVQQEIKTCCVGQVKTGKVRFVWPGAPRRSPTRYQDLLCWTGKDRESKICLAGSTSPASNEIPGTCYVGQVKTEKVRLSGREHLAGVQREIETRRVGQVKTEESKIVWPGAPRRRPTGGKYSRSGWVSLAGRGVEKVRLSGREALAGVRWESDGRSRLTVGQVKMER